MVPVGEDLMINKNIIYLGMGLIFIIFFSFVYSLFQSKNLEIANLNIAVAEYQTLVTRLDASNSQIKLLSKKQNESIKALAVDRDISLAKLEQWKALPPKVKYEIIYKSGEIKSNECKYIKNIINDVRSIDFDSL